jgi:hypothetical protein
LGVEVREVPARQQRVVAEPDPRNDMAGTESNLLDFGEVFADYTIQDVFPNDLERYEFLGPDFGRIERVEVECVLLALGDGLDCKLPFRWAAVYDGFLEILAVEVYTLCEQVSCAKIDRHTRILAGDLESLVPYKAMNSELWDPMEFDKMAFTLRVD